MHPDLVQIHPDTHNVILDIAYATPHNITHAPIYQHDGCYLHKTAALHLEYAIGLAATLDLRFKIFDAFRPLEGQWTLWQHFPNSNYISHPEQGSTPHCRGVAIDLTLIDSQGTVLDMGTPFDHLGEEAHHGYLNISTEAQKNRLLLIGIMTSAGWDFYRNEWWHYQLFNPRAFSALTDAEAQVSLIPPLSTYKV